MDLSTKKPGDIGLLKMPEHSQLLWHLESVRKIGMDVYTMTLFPISMEDGFEENSIELDAILFEEGYCCIQVQ